MSAKIINGTVIADNIKSNLKSIISSSACRKPCLTVVLVGDRKDSEVYVKMKEQSAHQIGIEFRLVKLDSSVSQALVEQQIVALNDDMTVDGIIIQLPLPATMNASAITQTVLPEKDVDGFHPLNVGHLLLNDTPLFTSCTARGVMVLIEKTGFYFKGKKVVLIGTGMVGKPLSMMLLRRDATVMCCNKDTQNIEEIARQGDVIIAAAGCPLLVKKDWIKPGAIVIDVGINSIRDQSRKSGFRLVGDVDFDEVSKVASFITPVPGGVGPMTVAMLMTAVVESWSARILNT